MPATDFLADPNAADSERGAESAYTDLGYAAPRDAGAPGAYATPTLYAPRVSAPAADPLSDPAYKQVLAAHNDLLQHEKYAHQSIKDFDVNEGAALKWKTEAGVRNPVTGVKGDPTALASNDLQADLLSSLKAAPGSPENIAVTKKFQLLAEKRQRMVDEANRITHNRSLFAEQVVNPMRERLLSQSPLTAPYVGQSDQGGGSSQPATPDYLAPQGDDAFSQRVQQVQATRRANGQPPLAPGSVSAGNFTERWGPVDQERATLIAPPAATQPAEPAPEENNNLPSESSTPEDNRPSDALAPAAIQANQNALAQEAKDKIVGSMPSIAGRSIAQSGVGGLGGVLKGVGAFLSNPPVGGNGASVSAGFPTATQATTEEKPSEQFANIQGSPIYQLGSALQQAANEVYPLSKAEKDTITAKLGGMAGGFIPLVASGPAAPATIGLQAFGNDLDQIYQEEIQSGKTQDEAASSAINRSMASGAAQAAIFEFLPKPLQKLGGKAVDAVTRGTISRFLAGRLSQAGQGAVLGGTSQAAANVTAGRPIGENVPESAAGLGIVQALTGTRSGERRPPIAAESNPPSLEPPVVSTDVTPDVVAAKEAPAQPVNIGERNPEVSTGTGVATPTEEQMIADWKAQIAAEQAEKTTEEPNNAGSITSTESLGKQPLGAQGAGGGGGKGVERGNEGPPPAGTPAPETEVKAPDEGLPGGGGEVTAPQSISEAWDQFDNTGQIETARDLADHVERLVQQGGAPKELQGAVDKYRKAVEEDHGMAGRSDLESAENEFTDAVRQAAGTKETSEANAGRVEAKANAVDTSPIENAKSQSEALNVGGRMLRDAKTPSELKAIQDAIRDRIQKPFTSEKQPLAGEQPNEQPTSAAEGNINPRGPSAEPGESVAGSVRGAGLQPDRGGAGVEPRGIQGEARDASGSREQREARGEQLPQGQPAVPVGSERQGSGSDEVLKAAEAGKPPTIEETAKILREKEEEAARAASEHAADEAAKEVAPASPHEPEMPAEEALPVPPGRTARDMVRMSARVRAIDKKLESTRGQNGGEDRRKLLEERLTLGAQMGHVPSQRALEKWQAQSEQPRTIHDIVQEVVRAGPKGKQGISTKGEFGNEVKMLKEGSVPKHLISAKGSSLDGISDSVKELTDKEGLTRPEDPRWNEGEMLEMIKKAFAQGEKMPPRLDLPDIKVDRATRAAIALRGMKFQQPNMAMAHNPLTLAWDGAMETAALAIEGGKKGADAVKAAVEHFKQLWPDATADHISRLENTVKNLVEQREAKGAALPAGVGSNGIGSKNESVEAQNPLYGRASTAPRTGMKNQEIVDQANARAAANSNAGREVVERLSKSSDAGSPVEAELVTRELTRIKNDRDGADRQMSEALKSGDKDAIKEAQEKIESVRAEYNKTAAVADRIGTRWSDVGRARQIQLANDFSIAELERRQDQRNQVREKLTGKPVPPEEKASQDAKIKELHDKYQATLEAAEKGRVEAEKGRASAELELAWHKMLSDSSWAAKAPAPERASIIKGWEDKATERGNSALAKIHALRAQGKVASGLDPEVMAAYADLIGSYMAKGVLHVGQITERLIRDAGEEIRPFLDKLTDPKFLSGIVEKTKAEREQFIKSATKTGRDIAGERKSTIEGVKKAVKEVDPNATRQQQLNSLGRYAHKLAMQHIDEGVHGREAVLDVVHENLKEAMPDITREEASDVLSGYGRGEPLDMHPVKVELRDIKGQLQQLGKLRDMQGGNAPKKTGKDRRVPSDEERRLIKQVEEAKKRGGYNVTDPAKQLKSAQDAIKTRLKNQIADLNFQISTGKKFIAKKTTVPHDAETAALVAKRDALKKTYDEAFPKQPITNGERVARSLKAVNKAIEDQKALINEGGYKVRTKAKDAPTSLELDARRAELEALRAHADALRNLDKPEGKTQAQRENDAYQARLASSYSKNLARLARAKKGDFSKPESLAQPKLDRVADELKVANLHVKNEIEELERKEELKNRTLAEKGIDVIPKASRFAVLTYPSILLKLTAAAGARMVHSVAREGVISGLRQIPGIKGIAAKAPRFGKGFQLDTEIQAHTAGIMRAIRASGQHLKGKDPNEVMLYGKPRANSDWDNYIGHLHGALKTPAQMTEFERSWAERAQFEKENGGDIHDPAVKMKIGIGALKDANDAIFMGDSTLVKGIRAMLSTWRNKKSEQGGTSLSARAGAAAVESEMPIMKVPFNILDEVAEGIHGPYTAAIRAIYEHTKGLDKTSPEAADMIMRQLANGVIGNALLIAGWYGYKSIGPFHQQNEKPRAKIPQEGTIKAGEHEIPKMALHNPWAQTMEAASTAHHLVDDLSQKKGETPSTSWAIAKSMLDLGQSTPVIQEATNISKAVENPEHWFPRHLGQRVVPGISQAAAQYFDKDKNGNPVERRIQPNAKGTEAFKQQVMLGIPGLRQRVDQTSYVDSNVAKNLNSLGFALPNAEIPQFGPPKNKRPATDAEYSEFSRQYGKGMTEMLAHYFPNLSSAKPDLYSPAFGRKLNESDAEEAIKKMSEIVHKNVRQDMELKASLKRPAA